MPQTAPKGYRVSQELRKHSEAFVLHLPAAAANFTAYPQGTLLAEDVITSYSIHYTKLYERFIAELMPHHPLYVSLLAEEAQAALGQVHPDARLQFDLLEEDGFEADDFVEIFDAGPVVQARRTTLHSWQTSQLARVADISPSRQSNAPTCLLVNTALAEFRAP